MAELDRGVGERPLRLVRHAEDVGREDLRGLPGRHDPIPVDATEQTARLLRAELAVFEESGHCPYVEETDRFVRELDAWLPRAR